MKPKVKICGITTLEDAKSALALGADFLGFNFVPTSKRYIHPVAAKRIIDEVGQKAKIVGVFKDESADMVNTTAQFLSLDFVQLHGSEDESYVTRVLTPVIKVFQLPSDFDARDVIAQMKQYNAAYFLLDREKQGQGKLLNKENVAEVASVMSVFLAGGLTPENVNGFAMLAKPYAMDVAKGVETDGKKDKEKMQAFINNVKGAL